MPLIAPFSDLHLEHANIALLTEGANVVVLAGDIYALGQAELSSQETVIDVMARIVSDKPVVFGPGNHDLENSIISKQLSVWKHISKERYGGRIHVLFNESVDIDGVRFLGTPLFTNFASTGMQEKLVVEAQRVMPDFRKILVSENVFATAKDYCIWHEEAKQWLNEQLDRDLKTPKVVVTHFSPSFKISPRRRTDTPMDAYWTNNCEELVEKAHLWISGHTHCCAQAKIGKKKNKGYMVSNARGYSKIFNLSADRNFKRDLRLRVP